MADEHVLVSIHRYDSGQLKAFADVTVLTPLGEVTIRGFRVVHKSGQAPWIAFPATSYQKDGKTKFKDLLDTPQATHRKLAEAILAEFTRVSESSSELPVRPQRD
jgi:DNA-binding cell septation regulator SpoVG